MWLDSIKTKQFAKVVQIIIKESTIFYFTIFTQAKVSCFRDFLHRKLDKYTD